MLKDRITFKIVFKLQINSILLKINIHLTKNDFYFSKKKKKKLQ